ncbi:MAG: glutamine--fructose-6-phosphate transaminase (isomerizing) [Candidatus Woesearchaeota archaeon]
MCGIIAFKSRKKVSVNNYLIDGLKKLEYRGYDSFGIAYKSNSVEIIKRVGKIGNFSFSNEINSEQGIAHTRWATHGGVNEINAHPHTSKNRKIIVAHNGIIENYQEIKDFLLKNSYDFYSETDTEVIPQLIQYFMDSGNDFLKATKLALKELEGSFAVAIMYGNEMIGARNGSPLVMGIKNKDYFMASDIPAFLKHTNKVIFLEDGELVHIDENNNIEFFKYEKDEKIEKREIEVDYSVEEAEKGSYPHFMLKEIEEQKYTIRRAVQQDKELIRKVSEEIKNAKGIFFVGAGTSYHACFAASYLFSHIAKMHVNVVLASEFPNYKEFINEKTLVIALSQSGETADVLEAVKSAKRKNARVISIVNVVGSSLTRISDYNIMMNAGPEICVLSTKSYTSQLAIIVLLAYAVTGKEMKAKEIIESASKIVPEIIKNKEQLFGIAEKLKDKKDIFLIGRNSEYPTALEGALKIKEVSYIHAEGFAGGELKHGTIALIEKGTPVIVFCSERTRKQIISNAMEVKARGAYVIGISSRNNEVFDEFFKVEEIENANNILMIIPIQILAYKLAVLRGLDPDKPRNLAKSVTVK